MSFLKRWEIAAAFFTFASLFIIFESFTGIGSGAVSELISWGIVLWTFTYMIGAIYVFRLHVRNIAKRNREWIYSMILLVSFFSFLGLAYLYKPGYTWVLTNVYTNLTVVMFSFVGFYTYTILFRGARSRSLEARLLLFTSVLIMLFNAPFGETVWSGFKDIGGWIQTVPNTGVTRGIMIGVAIGMIATFVRTLLGMEKSYLGGES